MLIERMALFGDGARRTSPALVWHHRDVWRHVFLAFLICVRFLYRRHSYPMVVTVTKSNNNRQNEDGFVCIGWRQDRNCPASSPVLFGGIDSILPSLRDLPCDQPIPKGSSGSCELQAPNGTIVHALHKTCTHRHHPKAKYLTCNMAVAFMKYKEEAHAFHEDPFQSKPHENAATTKRRGIVMSVYDDVLVSAYAVIRVLREHNNCTLPIELWSKPHEIKKKSALLRDMLKDPSITHQSIGDDSISGFMSKPYSLFHSVFDEVLLLDADTLPLKDPTYLFDTREYQKTGAVFFPDYWSPRNTVFSMTSESLLWELLSIPFVDEFEMESGQLLVDKTTPKAALNMLMFLARTHNRWIGPLSLAWGDKDLFRFAWRMTKTDFHFIQQPPSTLGFSTENVDVCGVTILQHDPSGDPIFLHRNTVKLKDHTSLEKVWWKSQTFVGDNALEQYGIHPSPVKGRKIKCYHPTLESSKWFRTKNLAGTNIEAAEQALLKFAKEALHISS